MNVNNTNEKLNIYVKRTVLSGVKPIEILFKPIYDCDYGETTAYRGIAKINSVVTGVLTSDDFIGANVDETVLRDVFLRILTKTILSAIKLTSNDVKFKFITVKSPTELVYRDNIYNILKTTVKNVVTEENDSFKSDGICLEFDGSVMDTDSFKLKDFFADIRAAGFKVAVSGYGAEEFPIEKVLAACPDYVFCDKRLAELSKDREKGSALAPLINLVKSLGGNIIATGISNDDELREFKSRDCFGFIPSENYGGRFEIDDKIMTYNELLKRSEVEDGR